MTCSITQWTLDAHDVDTLATFWSQALGYQVEAQDDGTCHLLAPPESVPGAPTVWIQHAGEPKTVKNRNHPDLRVDHGGVDAEVMGLCVLR